MNTWWVVAATVASAALLILVAVVLDPGEFEQMDAVRRPLTRQRVHRPKTYLIGGGVLGLLLVSGVLNSIAFAKPQSSVSVFAVSHSITHQYGIVVPDSEVFSLPTTPNETAHLNLTTASGPHDCAVHLIAPHDPTTVVKCDGAEVPPLSAGTVK